jgi:tight adherence protein B
VLIVGVRRLLVTSRRRTDGERRSSQVLEVCEALSAELRSGLPAPVALSRACATWPDLSPVVSAAELGGDVVQALRDLARVPGADGLRALAAAWVVAGQSGASLAVVVDRVAEGLRHDDAARREVAASLGPPRATARMLAVLPVFGVGLGLAIGADPLHFLLATTAGSACLVGGAGLAIGGLLWVERLASAVEGSGRPLPMAER